MAWSAQDFAEMAGGFRRELAGIVRRMTVSRSGTGIWQLAGHLLLDGLKRETREVENYSGIGIYARPPDNGSAEGIAVNVGGPNNPALIAMRDEGTRTKVDDIAPDESTLYNSQARIYVKADGTVEVRTHAGVAVSLALKSDVAGFVTTFNGHLHTSGGSGSPTSIPTTTATAPVGTTQLKGQ